MYQIKNKQLKIPLGKYLRGNISPDLIFHNTGWQRILIEGESGAGKSAHAKDIVVRVSKSKKVCVFSLKGEWEKHVTDYNPYYKASKQKLINYKLLDNYSIKLSEFDDPSDWISLGFSEMGCGLLSQLIKEGKEFYKDDPKEFQLVLNSLPTKQITKEGLNLLYEYEKDFGILLNSPVFPQIKQSIIMRFEFIRDWFWVPNDERNYFDFVNEWMFNDNLIINISNDRFKARALCGLILRKLSKFHWQTRGLFVFEEARVLFPDLPSETPEFLLPSSVRQIYDILTMGRKEGISVLLITQREDQLYKPAIEHFFTKIIVGKYLANSKMNKMEYELALTLKWDPNFTSSGYRTCLLYYKTGRWCIYEPRISCCKS